MNKTLGVIFFKSTNFDLGNYLITNLKVIFKGLFTNYQLILKPLKIASNSFNIQRNQYLALPLLEQIRNHAIDNDFYKVLGITSYDLYAKELNFIFGQAEFGNADNTRAAIISTYRLRTDTRKDLIRNRRILKEAIHEIGHTLNLSHCVNQCVMQFSNSLAEVDIKPTSFCLECRKKLALI